MSIALLEPGTNEVPRHPAAEPGFRVWGLVNLTDACSLQFLVSGRQALNGI